jgi:hypothetical protein
MHKIIVIRLFILDALHVSDYISPSSGATLISCTSHILVYADTHGCCVAIPRSHTTSRRMVPAYTKLHNLLTYGRTEQHSIFTYQTNNTQFIDAPEDGPVGPKHVEQ